MKRNAQSLPFIALSLIPFFKMPRRKLKEGCLTGPTFLILGRKEIRGI